MNTRIYKVTNKDDDTVRLVEATSAQQALRHVAASTWTVAAASAKEVAEAMANGATYKTAGEKK